MQDCWWKTDAGNEWLVNNPQVGGKFFEDISKHSIGNRYIDAVGDQYILAQVGIDVVCMICLKSGNRYIEPVNVKDSWNITKDEFFVITDNDPFTKQ